MRKKKSKKEEIYFVHSEDFVNNNFLIRSIREITLMVPIQVQLIKKNVINTIKEYKEKYDIVFLHQDYKNGIEVNEITEEEFIKRFNNLATH